MIGSFKVFIGRLMLLGILLATIFARAQQAPLRTFALTDMEPWGAVVDAQHNQVFVSIAELNRIDVYSLDTRELMDRIAIPSPAGMDLTLDGSRLIVGSGGKYNLYTGSGTQFLSIIDPATHKVVNRYAIPNVLGYFYAGTMFPDLVVCLAGDLVAMRLGSYDSTLSAFIKLDLNTGVFAPLKPPFGFDIGTLQRVGPTSKVLITDTSNSGMFIIYDVAADQAVAQSAYSGYFVWGAASPDGNRIVISKGPYAIHILDGQLNELATGGNNINIINGVVFSSDSTRLYVPQASAGVYFDVVDTATARTIGQAPGMFSEHGMAVPLAYDPHGFVVAKTEHGVAFLDASVRQPTGTGPGSYAASVIPTAGPLSGGTQAKVSSTGLTLPSNLYVGTRPATQVAIQSTNFITFVTPQGQNAGPQDVVVDFLNGWRSYLPQAFTYGPTILYTDMSAGPMSGGTKMRIVGYGFGYDAAQISVTVGGRSATIDKVSAYPGISPWILPTHNLYITVPSGSLGTADITVRTPDGSTTSKDGFRYYATRTNSTVNAIANNLLFDRWRNRVLASATSANTIDVVDAVSFERIAQVTSVASPLGMSFTPDGTKLVVASAADELVVLDAGAYAVISRLPVSVPGAYGRPEQVFPETVAVAANGKALVGVPDFDMLDNAYLMEVDLATDTQKLVDAPWPAYLMSYLDLRQIDNGTKLMMTPLGSLSGGRYFCIWDAVAEKFTEVHWVPSGADVAFTDDAQVFAISRSVVDNEFRVAARASSLGYTTPYGTLAFGLNLHPGGALLLEPHTDSIWVFDANTGNEMQRIAVPGKVNIGLSAMTMSPDGASAYLLTNAGLVSVDLRPLPLTIGTVMPNEVSSANGSSVRVRGSGFREGAAVFVDDIPVTAHFVDDSTLDVAVPALEERPYSLTVRNIDGSSYTKPVALNVYGSQPIIKGVTPATLDAGVGDVSITVFGLNFQQGSTLAVNDTSLQTTRNTSTNLSAAVPAAALQTEGVVILTASNTNGAVSAPFQVPVKYPPGHWGVGTSEFYFGIKHVGDQFSYDLKVSDSGTGPLFDVLVSMDAPAFSQTNDCPSTLMPRQGCTIHLVLDTSVARDANGVVHLIARNTSLDVKLIVSVVPVGPYLLLSSVNLDVTGWLGQTVSASFWLKALDQSATVTAVRADDPSVTVTNECTTVTTNGCGISMSFVPQSVATKQVTVTIESNASNSPLTAVAHFTGSFPLRFFPDRLDVGRRLKDTPIMMSATLQNYSPGYTATIQQLLTAGPVSASTRQCGSTIAPNTGCLIDVTLNSAQIGPLSGSVTVVTPDGTVQLPVTATVVDFAVQVPGEPNPSITVSAGQTGTKVLEVVPVGDFSALPLQLSCTTAIPAGSCSVTPASVTIDSSGAHFNATLSVFTTKRTLSRAVPVRTGTVLAWLSLGMLAFGALLVRPQKRALLTLLCAVSLLTIASCGGGGSSGSNPGGGNPPSQVATGTPSGSYVVTVYASDTLGTPPITRSLAVTVKVQ